ncbi:DUF4062 domain-containing protein [Priestia aryabhattai]|uniref:DUF4062 domain-containing protein n=1 Tax=Priestia aryabhattai TaxID=412384 RepID=UPI003CF6781E
MANPIKIFISSVAQDKLSSIRENIFTELHEMSHQPVMYEKNIGPWPQHEAVKRCLDAVSESDIFILIISDKGGTYQNDLGATVTHLEFQRAYKEKKVVLPFVEDSILQMFWDLKSQIEEQIKIHIDTHGSYPNSYKEIAEKAWENHPTKQSNTHIESYVWGFLYDIYKKGYYFESVAFGSNPITKVKEYFSDLFRQGSHLLGIAPILIEQAEMSELHQSHTDFSVRLLDLLKDGEINNYRLFLAHIQNVMKGGSILYKKGTIFEEEVGRYQQCSGTTLYKKSSDLEELIFLEASGTASDDNKKYSLNDQDSFVVQSFLDKTDKQLFFNEEKQQLYFTINVNNYVLCLHYPVAPYLSEEQMDNFKNDVFNAILESESELYRRFVIKLLGGIK